MRPLELAGAAVTLTIHGLLVVFVTLTLLSACGPTGYGQRACLDRWSALLSR